MQKKEWIPVGAALLLLAFGAVYDYQITDTLYQTLPMTGMIFERFLLLPVQMMTVLAMAMLFRVKKNAFYLLIGYAASYYMLQDALHYWVSLQNSGVQLLLLAGSGGLIAVVQLVIQRIPYNWIQKHFSFFVFYTLVLLSAVLITTILKLAWGRIRYRDMQDAAQFCVWYKPCGSIGSNSFPSGHTTAFTTLMCWLQWKKNPYEKPSVWRYLLIGTVILFMPLTRMIMGAHFLSDTAMGFLITYGCYLYYRQFFRKRGYL